MSDDQEVVAIVLAAGQGTRMKSALPKMLHPVLGRPMLCYPVQAAFDAGASSVVAVLGHGRDEVANVLSSRFDARVRTALQEQQLGTGDAARVGAQGVPDHEGLLLILNGDAPLLTEGPLRALIARTRAAQSKLGLLTSRLPDAHGYGRILRDANGRVTAIREQKDCTATEAAITEWNPGVYAIDARFFRTAISQLNTQNAQQELYLTDLVAMAAANGGVTDVPWSADELHGVNDRNDLAARERDLRLRICRQHATRGVTIRDPETTFIDADVEIAPDVTLEAGVQLRGRCRIASFAHIDVGCVLTDVTLEEGVRLKPYSIAERSQVGARAQIGPFSHLRPDSQLGPETHIGNFVETKKTVMGRGSKANHLAYLGDGVIGSDVNVGAGTIFCNYDGFQKHVTTVEDRVFIGSDSQLVAPVTVHADVYIATGTTVTSDVPAEALAIGRARQVNKEGLGTRLREKLRAAAERAKQQRKQGEK